MYSSFVLLGLAIVIVFCLLGVVKSCSYGSGPLRALNFM
nr:NADH dehydrogenase subunit 6 [Cardita variegata]WLW42332.1 NADH dehydrogenase subunit 6 [Cardita variegata]